MVSRMKPTPGVVSVQSRRSFEHNVFIRDYFFEKKSNLKKKVVSVLDKNGCLL